MRSLAFHETPNYDLLRAVQVADSQPQSRESLRIVNAPDVPTVRIAAAVMPAEAGGIGPMTDVFEHRKTSPYEPTMATLASMAAEASAGGAKIVAFSEFAIVVAEADHAAARAAFSRIATEHGVWLALPYAWVPPSGKGANRHLLIDDRGRIRADRPARRHRC